MAKDINWERVKNAYLDSSESLASIALQFGISKRTVERRASEEGWATIKLGSTPKPPPGNAKTRLVSDVEAAIDRLSEAVQTTEAKSLEGCASALGKLVELHRKLVPETASELAARAVELGIKPKDFMKALTEQWQEQDDQQLRA